MKCTRCSAELPAQSQFCLRCGTPVHAPSAGSSSMVLPQSPVAPRANNRPLWIAVAILALVVLGLGLKMLTQKAGTGDSDRLVQAPGQGISSPLVQAPGEAKNGPLVQAPGAAQPPPVVQNPAAAPTFPYDVDDYLKFLKKVEAMKMDLTHQQMAQTLSNYAGLLGKEAEAAQSDEKSKEFLPNINRDSDLYAKKWDELTRYFNSKTPPPSCQDLHDKYYDYLGKVAGSLAKLNIALAQAQTDPSKALEAATSMQGTASAEVDSAARSADDELADVCSKFHLHKDFDIKTDPSSFTGLSH